MVEEKSWKEFRDSGMLWWTNMVLHTFGWSIVLEVDTETGEIEKAYPARVRYRGFSEEVTTEGYKRVSRYLKDNCETLLEEAES